MGKRFGRKPRYFYIRFVSDPGKSRQRIKIDQPPDRPLTVRGDLLDREYLSASPHWFVEHRRGIRRPRVGQDPLEARAVSENAVRGTLPERIVYKALLQMRMQPGGRDFDFQCVGADHKVLTADMKWIPAGELEPGDELLSFDEEGPAQAWKKGTVQYNSVEKEEVYKVALSDGTEILATPEHPWLVRADARKDHLIRGGYPRWFTTSELKENISIFKYFDVWEQNTSFEAGWLSGFFDGDGSVVHDKTTTGGHALSVTVSQNAGPMFDRFVEYTDKLGFEFSIYDYRDKYKTSYDYNKYRKVISCRIAGGRSEALRFLGVLQPMKIDDLDVDKLGKMSKIEELRIESVEPAGVQEVAKLSVDCKTYLVEGLPMHNSSLLGGRLQLGGIVADFLFEQPRKMIINVQGPTHERHIRKRKDAEQEDLLADMGFEVYYLTVDEIGDSRRLWDRLRQIFSYGPGGGGGLDQRMTEDEGANDLNLTTVEGSIAELKRLVGNL